MKKYLKMLRMMGGALVLTVIPAFFSGGCGQRTECEKSIDTAMGTVISQTVYVTEKTESVTNDVLETLNSLEQEELSWRMASSEVARINASAGGEAPISAQMSELLTRCLQVSAESDGAFDITIGQLSRIRLETGADGSAKVTVPEGMQLDLGAVGKGVALDEIRKTLEEHPEVSGAVISVGGSILTYGSKPEGGTWQIAVTDPLNPSDGVGILTLDGGYCVSTSGDYERYVEVDGVRYHHILDPRTGSPARSDVAGVTIITKDGFLSDALSTACFVLGQEQGKKLLEKYDAEGLFIDHEGNISMTEGMQQYFHLSNDGK